MNRVIGTRQTEDGWLVEVMTPSEERVTLWVQGTLEQALEEAAWAETELG